MKSLRLIAFLAIVVSIVVLDWNCQNENIQNTVTTNSSQADDVGSDGVRLTVTEYVYITPPEGDPYYGFIGVTGGAISHSVSPLGYTYSNFTTPYADRTINGFRYQTQHFKISKVASGIYTCITCNCAARYYISNNVLSEDHFYCNGSCTYCGISGNYYCSWSDEDNNINLAENTTYYFWVGSDCIVNDEWEIGE